MLSWRYLDHPQAGGAELLTHEVLRRCVARGWQVTCFTATYPGAPADGELDGVRLVRRGQQHTVHAHAWRWLRSRRSSFDRIVDQVNTVPFFTPLYVPAAQRELFIHQLAREYWFRQTRGVFRLLAPFGYLAEPWQMRLYRRTRTTTISASTKRDLEELGIDVTTVLPMAVDLTPEVELPERSGVLRCVSVGRLEPAKFVEETIEAFVLVQAVEPTATLDVMGGGNAGYRRELEALAMRLSARNVTFHGRVAEDAKRELLGSAFVHLFTSHREGWGLTVTEAARLGTPSVGYDVPGVRDSIGEPQLIAETRTPRGIADRVLELWRQPDVYARLRRTAWERASALNWDATAETFMEALEAPR